MPKLVDGVSISIGERTFVVPPLTLGQVKRLLPDINMVSGASATLTPELADAVVKIVQSALLRNYPDVSVSDVEEMVDLGNFRTVIDAIMGISGLKPSGEVTGETSR